MTYCTATEAIELQGAHDAESIIVLNCPGAHALHVRSDTGVASLTTA